MDSTFFEDLRMEQCEGTTLNMKYQPKPIKKIEKDEVFDKDGIMYSIDRFAKFGDIVE